jgi:hypothetical protein
MARSQPTIRQLVFDPAWTPVLAHDTLDATRVSHLEQLPAT